MRTQSPGAWSREYQHTHRCTAAPLQRRGRATRLPQLYSWPARSVTAYLLPVVSGQKNLGTATDSNHLCWKWVISCHPIVRRMLTTSVAEMVLLLFFFFFESIRLFPIGKCYYSKYSI